MKRIVVTLLATAALPLLVARAQNMDMSHHHDAAAPAAAEENGMGLGEIMLFQQARHIKLWFAGSASNWPLADHEVGELKEGFDDLQKQLGGDTVENAVGGPIAALEKAIDGKNSRRVHQGLRPAQCWLQRLPSNAQSRVHRDPAADIAALHRPGVQAAKMIIESRGRRSVLTTSACRSARRKARRPSRTVSRGIAACDRRWHGRRATSCPSRLPSP